MFEEKTRNTELDEKLLDQACKDFLYGDSDAKAKDDDNFEALAADRNNARAKRAKKFRRDSRGRFAKRSSKIKNKAANDEVRQELDALREQLADIESKKRALAEEISNGGTYEALEGMYEDYQLLNNTEHDLIIKLVRLSKPKEKISRKATARKEEKLAKYYTSDPMAATT